MDDLEVPHNFCQEDSASSCQSRICRIVKSWSRPTDNLETNAEYFDLKDKMQDLS